MKYDSSSQLRLILLIKKMTRDDFEDDLYEFLTNIFFEVETIENQKYS